MRGRAVRQRLDERRPVACSRPKCRVPRRLVHGEHVAAVDADARHPVADRLVGQRRRRGLLRERRRDRPLVVVAEEDDRRLHHPCERRALVERTLGRRAVAEQRERDPVLALEAASPRRTRPHAVSASRSARRSTRRCSPSGSTSRPDARATTRARSTPAFRAGARSPTRGTPGRSSRDPRARTRIPPAAPRGSRRSRTCRSAPGGGRRRNARRTSAGGRGCGTGREARHCRGRRPHRPGSSRRRR